MSGDIALAVSIIVVLALVSYISFEYGVYIGTEGCAQAIENAIAEYNATAHQAIRVAKEAVNTATYCAAKLNECYDALQECNYSIVAR